MKNKQLDWSDKNSNSNKQDKKSEEFLFLEKKWNEVKEIDVYDQRIEEDIDPFIDQRVPQAIFTRFKEYEKYINTYPKNRMIYYSPI